MATAAEKYVGRVLALADININGTEPWDMKVNDPAIYNRIMGDGSLGLGETYMEGKWEARKLDEFFFRVFLAKEIEHSMKLDWNAVLTALKAKFFNMQHKKRSKRVAKEHYDLGNDLYENMLDKRMLYTCAYWKNAKTLDEAQENKLELICKKIQLKPGEHVLDLGCGFGSFAKYAAEKHGAKVTAVNISEKQLEYAEKSCKSLPNVKFIKSDYRDAQGQYDKVVAIGLTEHVGYKNYKTLMETVNRCLKDEGLFLLHTIGSAKSLKFSDPWFDKYIFPNGMLPSVKQLAEAAEDYFIVEDVHNFGADYDKTLVAWCENLEKNWPKLRHNYDERFFRMFKYYLLSLAGSFRARVNHLWQVVYSKGGIKGGYESVR